ncbi:aspartate aminotransferase family protein [Akkermansiaceae bacterium]|jgi:acetylornithine/succinyldiaminopimelate/putrescine aminotransferase|nr:aspartate aminotransferase family protein [Akkermansiaceae bacterium]MDB4466327.1 aspartate aminotransferase family protein [bacterium]MDA7934338.1 aspartate aminotransferase family protein [Akkermansiaceae bacterium]MDA9831015.1 aspartate aminotransferase family protein [Akkermansiaceae bacterium]MDB4464846.1 aspartate aminotransferase family protein [Akkermansiaceae bacterium]
MIPEIKTVIPGPCSQDLAVRLRKHESRNVTYVDESWPVFWERAQGVNVWDADGNRFLDFTSAFGVAGLGHRHPEIVAAMKEQCDQLLHGMGDVHPTALKVEMCARLSRLTFERWGAGPGKVVLSNSGFEAVETALKTARLATGKRGVMAFANGYHGLGYGSLLGTDLEKFRGPFVDQLAGVTTRVDYGSFELPDDDAIGAVLVEPIQGRGGKVLPPAGFLSALRDWCDAHGALLIFDEIYTGFHRTGKWFACEWEGVIPDLICVGKAMSGGFPISACVGKSEVMDKWPESPGEALHTSTFLGHPVGCAMALKSLEILERHETIELVAVVSARLSSALQSFDHTAVHEIRGRGMMWGMELDRPAGGLLASLLAEGLLFLADGPQGNVLSFTPPFLISEVELDHALTVIRRLLDAA